MNLNFFQKKTVASKLKTTVKGKNDTGLSNKFALRWLNLSKPPHLV